MGEYDDEEWDDEQNAQKRSSDGGGISAEMESLREENDKLRSKLQVALTTGTSGMCDELRDEFIKLIQSKRASLAMSVPDDINSFNDQQAIHAMSNIAKALSKANSSGTAHRTSTAGSRAGTAGLTATHEEVHAMHEHISQLQDELRNAFQGEVKAPPPELWHDQEDDDDSPRRRCGG